MSERDLILVSVGICVDGSKSNQSFPHEVNNPMDKTIDKKLCNVRFYATASNLWTWAAYDNYDPEAVSAGSATQTTPPLKTVTFGLNINF